MLAQPFNRLELLWRQQPARHPLAGFVQKLIPIGLRRSMLLPRRVVTLLASPRDVAAVNRRPDLKFSLFRICVPPTELRAHALCCAQPHFFASANLAMRCRMSGASFPQGPMRVSTVSPLTMTLGLRRGVASAARAHAPGSSGLRNADRKKCGEKWATRNVHARPRPQREQLFRRIFHTHEKFFQRNIRPLFERSDFVAANPDEVGPTGRTFHTPECEMFRLERVK